MGRKTPPWPSYPAWTTARYWQFVRSALRRMWLRWPPRFDALKACRRDVKGKRHKYEYECANCKRWFQAKHVEVDHINPVGSLSNYKDLVGFVQRLLAPVEGLRVLCKACHLQVTKEERKK